MAEWLPISHFFGPVFTKSNFESTHFEHVYALKDIFISNYITVCLIWKIMYLIYFL